MLKVILCIWSWKSWCLSLTSSIQLCYMVTTFSTKWILLTLFFILLKKTHFEGNYYRISTTTHFGTTGTLSIFLWREFTLFLFGVFAIFEFGPIFEFSNFTNLAQFRTILFNFSTFNYTCSLFDSPSVIVFDQHFRTENSKRWSKYAFFMFFGIKKLKKEENECLVLELFRTSL